MTDQHLFHALGFIQNRSADYAGKVHIRTPNIDALAERGIYFETAYCAFPECAPARTSIKTGTTVQRHGVLVNTCIEEKCYERMPMIERRIKNEVSFEQLLVEEQGFVAESYGKWHTPLLLYYERSNKSKPVIQNTLYHEKMRDPQPYFSPVMSAADFYRQDVKAMLKMNNITVKYKNGFQYNKYSGFPYDPSIQLDPRYGYPTLTPLTQQSGFEAWQLKKRWACGVDGLPDGYTATDVVGKWALQALERLSANKSQPFLLSVHFGAPHPPVIAPPEYFWYYFKERKKLYVAPSIKDKMRNSAFNDYRMRRSITKVGKRYPLSDPIKIAELTAAYYAMIEEVDEWVGKLVGMVDQMQIRDQTMIIFTADHGEMLGAHGRLSKDVLWEEAARVPLIIRFPGMNSTTTIHQPVSTMDLHSTILDYLGAGHLDQSDGSSLRRFIDGTSYNKDYDETTIVTELDCRMAVNRTFFKRGACGTPMFMIRKANYKLILTKLASSPALDMMYNLERDPYEINNLIGKKGPTASDKVIGKAEHLKILLLEWLQRMDGPEKFYSDPKYNLNVGKGDIYEIRKRRTWREVLYWESDDTIGFGSLVQVDGNYVQNEYFYVGRSRKGKTALRLDNIRVGGVDSQFFFVDKNASSIDGTGFICIKVSLVSSSPFPPDATLDAQLEFDTNYKGNRMIAIVVNT